MGIIHYAYFLDSAAFRLDLAKTEVQSVESLRVQARRAFTLSTIAGRDFLQAVCFDEEWLEEVSEEVNQNEELFRVYVSKDIQDSHRLSLASFGILEQVLPVLGWSKESIRLLLVGRRFTQLAEYLGLGVPMPVSSLSGVVSWLAVADAQMLLEKLIKSRDVLLHPGKALLDAARVGSKASLENNSESLLANSVCEIHERLNSAVQRKFDVILVNDVHTHSADKSRRLDPI